MSTNYSKLLLIPVIVILIIRLSAAQTPWTRITPTPVEFNINEMIRIPGTEQIYAVTGGSMFITSDNLGENWNLNSHPAGVSYDLTSVYFIDSFNGFIGGSCKSILKTTDGGINWSLKYINDTTTPYFNTTDFCFLGDSTGFALTEDGLLFKTINLGDDWTVIDLDLPYGNKFSKINEQTAYITNFDPNSWYKTTDGGESWILDNHSTGIPYATDICFINDSTAIASLGNYNSFCEFYKTTDYGHTWDSICTPDWGIISTSFEFYDELHGIALCNSISYYSVVLLTDDGGTTWSQIDQSVDGFLSNICYFDENTILFSGAYGTIAKSTDSGLTWNNISHRQVGTEIRMVQFLNNDIGYLTSNSIGGGAIVNELYKSTDGGNTWQHHDAPCPYPSAFNFFTESLGMMACENELYQYLNGEWNALTTGFDFEIFDIKFINLNTTIIAGDQKVIITNDGGFSWSDITPISAPGEYYYNIEVTPDNIYLTNGRSILWSDDMGSLWKSSFLGSIESISDFKPVDNNLIVATTGEHLYYSNDGMTSWITATINSTDNFYPSSLFFPTSSIGYAIGFNGNTNIIKTINGGVTWDILPAVSTSYLTDLYFSDENNGLVFSLAGLIAKTETGGMVSTGYIPAPGSNYNFTVSPNPFNDEVRIHFMRHENAPCYLYVTDLNGKLLLYYPLHGNDETVVPTKKLEAGVYVFKVQFKNGSTESLKAVKM